MAFFSRRIPGLQGVFPSSQVTLALPAEVSDQVQLTYPFPSPSAPLQGLARLTGTSAAALTPVLVGDVCPEGFYDEWLELGVSHTAATNREIKGRLGDPAGGAVEVFEINAVAGEFPSVYGSAGADHRGLSIFTPPGWRLDLIGQTDVGVYTVSIQAIRIRHPLAEIPFRQG